VLIVFERLCYVSLQTFEKAVNLSFQNQLTCGERIPILSKSINMWGKNSSRENEENF
jgi:hypothetical protein